MRTTFAVFLAEYLPSEIPVVRWRFGKVICSGARPKSWSISYRLERQRFVVEQAGGPDLFETAVRIRTSLVEEFVPDDRWHAILD